MRAGIGYDIHKLVKGRPLVLGGVTIPFDRGLAGHSDADVLCHAICDALLGAAGEGDIGVHFPDTDPQYKDIDSTYLLSQVNKIIRHKGFSVINIDATILAEAPKLWQFRKAMQQNIAEAVGTAPSRVNVKATTMEGLGSIGNKEGIAAICTALIASR
jgi:2-C-methyl-D-erythritol 2,4-cyclodiphosphate synthase